LLLSKMNCTGVELPSFDLAGALVLTGVRGFVCAIFL
jgi:hypothetical protein